jgi:hypothetical protein
LTSVSAIGPKTLDRALRYQRFLRIARESNEPTAVLAVAASDQAHLIVLASVSWTALVGADNERLAAVVVPWSEIEEFQGADPEGLARWLSEFAE